MANSIYTIDSLASDGRTVEIADDGTGIDTLRFAGVHDGTAEIRLAWYTDSGGLPLSASGLYFAGALGSRLVAGGVIENAVGSDGSDWISGNVLANRIWGDGSATAGGADTLFGDEGNDRLYGGAGSDLVEGAEDDDRLFGGLGDDTIYGGSGRDTVEGGSGADVLSGGADGDDWVSYADSGAGVRIDLTFGSTTTAGGGDAEGDTLNGFNNVVGSTFADVIRDTVEGEVAFGGNVNVIRAGDGNDTVSAGGGHDRILGGGGRDVVRAGGGDDLAAGGADIDRLIMEAGDDVARGGGGRDYLYGGDGDDLLAGGSGDDFLFGGDGRDVARGGGGDDVVWNGDGVASLYGGAGDDRLRGLDGPDHLFGGTGADQFDIRVGESRVTAATRDVLHDFSRGQGDLIDLSALTGQLVFIDGTAFTGAGREVRIAGVSNGLLVEVDTDGDRAADLSLLCLGVNDLRQSDFLL